MRVCYWLALTLCLLTPLEPRADEVPADAVVGVLPFLEHPEENRIFLDLAPEGSKPFRLLLDTGADGSVLTVGYARELGVTIRSHRETENKRETRLGRPLLFWVDTESSAQISRTGFEYGLLGGTFLAEYVLELDFPARQVRFLDAAKFQVPKESSEPGTAVLPLRIMGNRPFVKIGIEGRETEVLLDTGAPGTLMLSGKAARKAGIEVKPLAEVAMAGVLGKIESYVVEAKSLSLGPFAFSPAPFVYSPKGAYNMGGSNDSLLGYDVLQHFVVRIDYRKKRLWLRRADEQPLAFFGESWSTAHEIGALVSIAQGRLFVSAVFPDSPASHYGLRGGDSIARDDTRTPAEDLAGFQAKVRGGESMRVRRVTLDDDMEVEEEIALPAQP